eukprot:352544-Chlamydomonas_euryale.AAC.7
MALQRGSYPIAVASTSICTAKTSYNVLVAHAAMRRMHEPAPYPCQLKKPPYPACSHHQSGGGARDIGRQLELLARLRLQQFEVRRDAPDRHISRF